MRKNQRLNQAFVASIGTVEKDTFFWDADLKGFFVRAWPNAKPVWGIRYKHNGKPRTVVIGPCHEIKAEKARTRATELKSSARLGVDLVAETKAKYEAPTVADLAHEHQLVHVPPAINQDTFDDRATHWSKHIIPALGKVRVKELSRADVIKFHQSHKAQPHLANRLLATLSKAFNDCTTWTPRWREDNPCYRITKFEEPHRQTILSEAETRRVLIRLSKLKETGGPVFWLYEALLISGLRLSELSERRWSDINLELGTLHIPKAKNKKPRTVNLSADMVTLLTEIPRSCEWVFPSSRGKPYTCAQHEWQKIRIDLGIKHVRLHDLRHTLASYAMHDGGLSQREVMELLGHSQMSTTERYLNVHDERKKGISDRASGAIHGTARRNSERPTSRDL